MKKQTEYKIRNAFWEDNHDHHIRGFVCLEISCFKNVLGYTNKLIRLRTEFTFCRNAEALKTLQFILTKHTS